MAEDRDSLARSAFRRGARLASLPLGFAGRATLGLGKRLGGTSADVVTEEMQQRAAEQLFRVLGELKGGAMKFGQAMSLFESALPEDIAAPYRAHLARLQDSAPPMPTSRVHAVLARELGPEWRDSFVSFEPLPAAAASIGQVHRAVWADGRKVAVKVQYPGADEALRSDLKQIGRLSKVMAPLAGGMDVKSLVDELTARVSEELDYRLEAESQQQAAEGFAGHPEFRIPAVLANTSRVLVSEWIEGTPMSVAAAAATEAERNRIGLSYVRFLFAGPSLVGICCTPIRTPATSGCSTTAGSASSTSVSSRSCPTDCRRPWAGSCGSHRPETPRRRSPGCAQEGFVTEDMDAQDLLDYLAPFVEPAAVPEFQFNRDWMREQFVRVKDPRTSGGAGWRLNLPPSYLLIHRVWSGGLAVLCQMNVRAAFGSVLEEFLPGYALAR